MNVKKPTYAWYALYTRANGEKKVLAEIEEMNIEAYLPLTKTLRQWSDRKKWVEEPLFRCYVFVRVSFIEFFNVLNVPGVVNYISFGGKPQAIPDYQIENIRTFVKQEGKEIVLTQERVSKGVLAEVKYGPLKGVQGEIVEICGQSRILIRVDSIGCCLYTNISVEEIKLIEVQQKETKASKHERKVI